MRKGMFANSKNVKDIMKSNNKAFTLIELLAIIVILAIIAVITVPIILNIIDNSRKGAATDSAYGYKDAVNKWYVEELSKDVSYKLNGVYNVSALTDMGIAVSGNEPDDGWIKIENGQVIDYSIKIDDYILSLNNDEIEIIKDGEIKEINEPKISREINNVIYIDNEYIKNNPVYYNPNEGTYCTAEDYNDNVETNSDWINNGCLRWYFYSINKDGTKNMILDHNTTIKVAWANQGDYQNAENNSVGITYFNSPSNSWISNNRGGLSILQQLKDDTENWTNIPIRNDYYSVSLENNVNQQIDYKIDYSGYRARLLTIEEISEITFADKNLEDGGLDFDIKNKTQGYFYLDGYKKTDKKWQTLISDSDNKSEYSWLFDNIGIENDLCTKYGCEIAPIDSMYNHGYWLASPMASVSQTAWSMNIDGKLGSGGYLHSPYTGRGLRPVITIY